MNGNRIFIEEISDHPERSDEPAANVAMRCFADVRDGTRRHLLASPTKPVTLLGQSEGVDWGFLHRLHVVTRVLSAGRSSYRAFMRWYGASFRARAIAVNVVRGSPAPMT